MIDLNLEIAEPALDEHAVCTALIEEARVAVSLSTRALQAAILHAEAQDEKAAMWQRKAAEWQQAADDAAYAIWALSEVTPSDVREMANEVQLLRARMKKAEVLRLRVPEDTVSDRCKICDRPECESSEAWRNRPYHNHRKASVMAACAPCQAYKAKIKACHGAAVDWRARALVAEAQVRDA